MSPEACHLPWPLELSSLFEPIPKAHIDQSWRLGRLLRVRKNKLRKVQTVTIRPSSLEVFHAEKITLCTKGQE